MTCFQNTSATPAPPGAATYQTQAACLEACKEGACCEGTTCTVKPQCQCQGTGKTFKGVGTTCSPNPCGCCGGGESFPAGSVGVSVVRTLKMYSGHGYCADEDPFSPPPQQDRICASYSATFLQVGQALSCTRDVSGQTPTHGTVYGYVAVARDQNYSCRLIYQSGWPGGSCGYASYSWPFEAGKTNYSITYYSFLFLEQPTYAQLCISSLSPDVPAAPLHPRANEGRSYVFWGQRNQFDIEVSIA